MPAFTITKVPLVGGEHDGDYAHAPAMAPSVVMPGGVYTRRTLRLRCGAADVFALESLSDQEARAMMPRD